MRTDIRELREQAKGFTANLTRLDKTINRLGLEMKTLLAEKQWTQTRLDEIREKLQKDEITK